MLFKLTPEQLMIQNMVREFSRKVVAATASERDKTKEFPAENFRQMGELGLMGMMIPQEYGGESADAISYVLALSEIAYSCASTSVVMSVQNSIVCETLNKFGTEEQKQEFLVPLASGEIIGAFGLTEPEAGSDPVSQQTTAVRDGDQYIINGTKRFITSGEHSKVVLITAKTDETKGHKGISCFIIPKGTSGLIVGRLEDKMGLRASDTTDLIMENCAVPASNRVGKEGDGFKIAMSGLDSGRIGIAAQSYGVAMAAFDAAIKYAKKRKQFGAAVSKHQAIRFQIADMATQIEAAKQLIFSAASMKDRGETYTKEASIAKLFASEMVNEVTARAIQIHGGYGFTKDYNVERFYRDARVFTIYEGTSEIQRIVISNQVLKDKRKP
ncbi:MAG: acyl-CoA dehydrogenase [Desulfobacula sp.]|jgi:alkylation response protein AidB-like acyl-CoA dehydrogenase|uniref:acyl-CoA dehydrogenase family protein n=1 Tax=Desulfobacula sp. TaxID=2593537 RepID=UPI001DC33515|nr:acyl-CoA dehydrogenase [Desulfobacula sp.]MBT3484558.1 acyl-CoA dehydrogenase [Desulfobacula sp.]MBT3803928.1 acyl-CoA dehydrogenase [Desulfobacula sp.]MBT4023543.1 acyl-CoA dehydrogenase [Desulfobacula sp.]MBT4197789.1 acyl-CoA dehydrogenase [Desulfobacula sp.]